MLPSRVNRLQSFSTRTKSAKHVSLPLTNRNVCLPCTHPPEYVLPFPGLFHQNNTRALRCSSISSYSMRSSSPCGEWEPQLTSFHFITPEYPLSMHVSFMGMKRSYLWIRALKRGFSL